MSGDVVIYSVTPTPCGCCGGATGCSCALLIPPFDSPYADYATAAAVIADPLQVANCLAYNTTTTDMTAFSASFDGTTFSADGAWSIPVASFGPIWISLSAKSGETITITPDSTHVSVTIYGCDGSVIESLGNPGGPVTSSALSADGEYYLSIQPNGGPPPFVTTFTTCNVTVTSSDVIWVNLVIALWDDSGTTRQLWACPKLLLPPLTESTGDWYASCADAAADIAAGVSNCVGYAPSPGDSFTATDGGTSLTLNGTQGLPSHNMFSMWGGVNAIGGQTLSAAFSTNGGSPTDSSFDIYDDMGVLVESLTGGTTLTSAALPYTGRYTIVVHAGSGAGGTFTDATTVITSSGTMSVNPIAAAYDVGLTCPALLSCGDACP